MAIIIGGLGLYGLISYITEIKTKEIGIRRVLGAQVMSVVSHLSRELIYVLSLAIFVGSILGAYTMSSWLENFSYKVSIGGSIFLFSALTTLCVVFITTGFKTIKAARANPADSLRYE